MISPSDRRLRPNSSLIVRRLASWRHVLCCSPAYLERHGRLHRPEDLVRHNCLRYAVYPFGDEWRFVGPAGEPRSVRVKGSLVTNSAEALRHVALAGQGLFLAPIFVAAEDLEAGRLVRLLEGYLPVEFAINAVYPQGHHLSAKVRRFIDLAAERFLDHQRWMSRTVAA